MNVQPLRLVVHGAHAIGLDNTVLLGEIGLRERLVRVVSNQLPSMLAIVRRTISSCESPIFLPMSLFIQSSPEEPPSLDIKPGTTRGILSVRVVVVKVRLVRRGRIVVAVWWRRGRCVDGVYLCKLCTLELEFLGCWRCEVWQPTSVTDAFGCDVIRV
jgi:hypothetical protein